MKKHWLSALPMVNVESADVVWTFSEYYLRSDWRHERKYSSLQDEISSLVIEGFSLK